MDGQWFESVATGGHPHHLPGWMNVVVWPAMVLVAILVRPRNG